MSLIGRRKKSKTGPEQVLGYLSMAFRALAAQRVARNTYKGYRWTRRLPYLIAGGALAAFVARKAMEKGGQTPSETGFTPPTPASPSPAPPAVPSTPTPTGSPTAVTPAPTAAGPTAPDDDGAPPAEAQT